MKKTILATAAAATAAVLVLAAPASAKTYICKLTEQGKSNWIPQVVRIDHDEKSGKVTVIDPLIKHYKEEPIAGEVATANSKRITYAWTLDKITNKHGGNRQFTSGLRYRITIQRASNKASIWAQPNGYANQFRGKGSCEARG